MTRQWRINLKGLAITSYHEEMSEEYFRDNDDVFRFWNFGEMSERFEVEVYAYVLMNSHYRPPQNIN